MARFIDADKLIEKWHNTLKDKNPDDLAYKCFTLFIDGLKKEPSADVVPKSEVAKIITTIKENFEIGYGGVCEFNKLLDDIEKKYAKESGGK